MLVTGLLAACCFHGSAHAQMIEQYVPTDIPGYEANMSGSVTNRMNSQGQPTGIELGDFVILPALNESAGYNSNTLGAPNSGSAEIETQANLAANSNWSRNALKLSFNLDDHRFLDVPTASYTNWTAAAEGSLNLGNDTANLAYSHSLLNLAATSIGVAGITTPVPYTMDDIRGSYLKLLGRVGLIPSIELENFTFGAAGPGGQNSYANLNHRTETGSLAARLERVPGNAVVVVLRASVAQFDNDHTEDYSDYLGLLGLDMQGDPVLQYRLLVGVESRHFSSAMATTKTIPSFELNVVWTPTELDTITITGTHRMNDPTSPFVGEQDSLDGRLQYDHELRETLFVSAFTEAIKSNSRSAAPAEENFSQTQYGAGIAVNWEINRHLSATINYNFNRNENSNGLHGSTNIAYSSPSFSSNEILIGFRIYE